jgi:hypothetical protein
MLEEDATGWGLQNGWGVICEKCDACGKDVGVANGSENILATDANRSNNANILIYLP